MYRRILIILEGKESDQALLDHLLALALPLNAAVTLLRVIPIADDGGGGLGRQFQLEIGSSGWRRKNEARAYLSRLERQLGAQGLSVETVLIIGTGSLADQIVRYAAEHDFDLIAMVSHSRPWYKRLLRSSQDDVLRTATVPTLFVNDSARTAPARRTVPRANPVLAILGNADL